MVTGSLNTCDSPWPPPLRPPPQAANCAVHPGWAISLLGGGCWLLLLYASLWGDDLASDSGSMIWTR